MSQVSQPGVFVLSIDVAAPRCVSVGGLREASDVRRSTAAAACAVAVAEHLATVRLPATWAVDIEANAELAADLATADLAHEIALLGGRSWAGRDAERSRVAAEIGRRVTIATAAGHALRTLVLTDGQVTEHLDLLVKHGFKAVRSISGGGPRSEMGSGGVTDSHGRGGWLRRARGADAMPAVRSLRWGLWEIAPSLDLVGQRKRALAEAVDQVAAHGGLVHLSLNLAGLTGKVSAGLKIVDRLAAQVAALRAKRRIETLTVAALAERLSRPRHQSPARSILRPAA